MREKLMLGSEVEEKKAGGDGVTEEDREDKGLRSGSVSPPPQRTAQFLIYLMQILGIGEMF